MKTWIYILSLLIYCNIGYAQTNWLQSVPEVEKKMLKLCGSDHFLKGEKPITADTWKQADLHLLEPYNAAFQYTLRAYVKIGNTKVYIIFRNHTEEKILWLCLFNEHQRLSDYLMAAYDNSEGFLTRETRFLPNGTLEITEYSEFEGTDEKLLFTISGLKFKKVD